MTIISNMAEFRRPDHEVAPIFPGRWSPRAMSGEPVGREELLRLFEAARWAPSSMNNQPWRFCYALRDTPHWDPFFGLLNEGNKAWCGNAGALVVVLSRTVFEFNGKPARTHSYDAGAAWACFALQGSLLGLVVHGMQGFSYDRAAELTGAGEGYQVEAMAAVGRPGRKEDLPPHLQEREFPSGRKPLAETVFEGRLAP